MLGVLSEDPRGLPAKRFASSAANRSNSSGSVAENPNLDIAAAAFVIDPPDAGEIVLTPLFAPDSMSPRRTPSAHAVAR